MIEISRALLTEFLTDADRKELGDAIFKAVQNGTIVVLENESA